MDVPVPRYGVAFLDAAANMRSGPDWTEPTPGHHYRGLVNQMLFTNGDHAGCSIKYVNECYGEIEMV